MTCPHEFSRRRRAWNQPATPRRKSAKDLTADRRDLRDLPLVTIDGETARDFDDAVSLRSQGKVSVWWRRLPASAIIFAARRRAGPHLDHRARQFGVFPRRVILMLPEALSNGSLLAEPGKSNACAWCAT